MVPHLKTALTGPLLSLEKHLIQEMANIEHWFRTQWLEHAAPFYASVDLRNASALRRSRWRLSSGTN